MKPQLLKVTSGPASSFTIRRDNVPFVNNHLHYHPEVELIYIKEGSGTQLIGDHIETFKSGDVILIGANLPHFWSFDQHYFSDPLTKPDIYVAHFSENFWGREFLEIPENLPLRKVLQRAGRGIKLSSRVQQEVGHGLEKMLDASGPRRLLLLQEALLVASEDKNCRSLSSESFQPSLTDGENDRINQVYQYSLENYKRKILISEIAAVACISPHSFCRYFKTKTKKTYSNFLIELRVSMACKLLIENRISIKQICFESGFLNFSSFHKYFKMITKKTPLNYQRDFLEN
ncbi:MAG: AraC family transcriptional regulator [Chitinophagaceae bacterium]|nr:MAG: AraC family transcriptional regulator [Chitinophagaceae bacterium]